VFIESSVGKREEEELKSIPVDNVLQDQLKEKILQSNVSEEI
jgi:hypothetical protein